MDPTLKETNIWKSVKKFFWDGLSDSENIFFDRILTAPQNTPDRWICVLIEQLYPRTVSTALMQIYMFSKNDDEGDNIRMLRDTIIDLLYPEYIALYDTEKSPWEIIGGILITIEPQSKIIYNPDKTKMIHMSHRLRWGAKW